MSPVPDSASWKPWRNWAAPRQRKKSPGRWAAAHANLATVYRSIALFENMGLVRRVELGDGQTRFELAGDDQHTHHHHHLFCKRCGRILKVEGCELSRFEASLARDHGYTEIEHRLEFFGIWPRCQSTREAGSPQPWFSDWPSPLALGEHHQHKHNHTPTHGTVHGCVESQADPRPANHGTASAPCKLH